MPVKSTSVSTQATAPKAPRKRRTRKTSQTAKATKAVKKTVAPKVTVTKIKTVAKKTTLKRPSTARLITADRYLKDFQTRWAIHNFEIQELLNDFVKGFEAVRPYHAQLVKLVSK
jgi:hypothetical protein